MINKTTIKINPEDKKLFEELLRQTQAIENKRITQDQLLGRIIKSQNVQQMALNDAIRRKFGK